MFYAQGESKGQVGFYVPLILPIPRKSVGSEALCQLRGKGLMQACGVTLWRCRVHASRIECMDGLRDYISGGILRILRVAQIVSQELSTESELVLGPRF